MNALVHNLKMNWYYMFTPPWRHSARDDTVSFEKFVADEGITDGQKMELARKVHWAFERAQHWFRWILGWIWSLCGLVGGALSAPALVQWAGLSTFPQQDWLIIVIAAIAGVLVQIVGWLLVGIFFTADMTVFMMVGKWSLLPVLNKVEDEFDPESSPQQQPKGLKRAAVFVLFLLVSSLLLLVVSVIVAVLLPIAGVAYGVFVYLMWIGSNQRSVTIAFVGGLLVKTFVIPGIKAVVTGAALKVLKDWLRSGKST